MFNVHYRTYRLYVGIDSAVKQSMNGTRAYMVYSFNFDFPFTIESKVSSLIKFNTKIFNTIWRA